MGYIKRSFKNLLFFVIEKILPGSSTKTPLRSDLINKILIIECGGIGDILRIFPAIEILHDNFPSASISILVSPASRGVLPLFKKPEIITEIIDFDIQRKHKGLLQKLLLISSLRRKKFDLIYAPLRGAGMRELSLMSFLIHAPHRLGFIKEHTGRLNTIHIEFADDIPILEQNISLLNAAGLKRKANKIEISIPDEDNKYAESLISEYILKGYSPLIAVHPSASWNSNLRCWPLEYYLRLTKALIERLNAKIILIGSRSEIEAGRTIKDSLQTQNVIDLIGRTTITQMAAIIQKTHLFIGNDSGPLHIAYTSGIPYLGIFGPTSAKQVLSVSDNNSVIAKKELACSPCYTHQPEYPTACRIDGSPQCLESVTVQEVLISAESLLNGVA